MKKLAIIAVLLYSVAVGAQPRQVFFDAEDVYVLLSNKQTRDVGAAYVSAVVDVLNSHLCLPKNITVGDLARTTHKHLAKMTKQERQSTQGHMAVAEAVALYQCGEQI